MLKSKAKTIPPFHLRTQLLSPVVCFSFSYVRFFASFATVGLFYLQRAATESLFSATMARAKDMLQLILVNPFLIIIREPGGTRVNTRAVD